jgi:hypothetical protein
MLAVIGSVLSALPFCKLSFEACSSILIALQVDFSLFYMDRNAAS